ncbi:MAG TPA: hypothetical protein DCY20_04945 [Firmicutes bacterium]|nr:hypothetical protein [Bacillota bacterium]
MNEKVETNKLSSGMYQSIKNHGSKDAKASSKQIDIFAIAKVAILVIPVAILLLGGVDFSLGSSKSSVEQTHQLQVEQLFESIGSVEIQSVNVAYTEKTVTTTSLFTSNQTSTVPNGVVIVYSGSLSAPYEVTQAISLLLDIPIHKISMLNTKDLGGN